MRKPLALLILFAFVSTNAVAAQAPQADCRAELATASAGAATGAATMASLNKLFGLKLEFAAKASPSEGDNMLMRKWQQAAANWEKIILDGDARKASAYHLLMRSVVQSALTKHFLAAWNGKIKETGDLSRQYQILEEIAKLEPARLDYGFFRIQRLVQARYSLNQFAECL